jgi:hypothetical protein
MLKTTAVKLGLSISLLLIASSAYALPEKDTGNLGEIRQSILTLENFQKIYGAGWVLMAGQDIHDTDLFKEQLWPTDHIPDARGLYLRGTNYDRDPNTGNPTPNLEVGAYMEDQFKSHTHTDAGHGHGHGLSVPTAAGTGGAGVARGSGGGWAPQGVEGGIHSGNANIQYTGGSETRPRSLVVNTYIKVNRTPESQQLKLIIDTLEKLPGKILENDRLHELFRKLIKEETSKAKKK